MASYPTAYRSGSAAYRPPVTTLPRPGGGGFQGPPKPANDNRPYRPPSRPANDNFPRPRTVTRSPLGPYVRTAVRVGGRVFWITSAALLLYDLYKWKYETPPFRIPWHIDWTGWHLYHTCTSIGGPRHLTDVAGNPNDSCSQYSVNIFSPNAPISPASQRAWVWEYRSTVPVSNWWRAVAVETWDRDPGTLRNPVPIPETTFMPVPDPYPEPYRPSWTNPFPEPGGFPGPTPMPTPYPLIAGRPMSPFPEGSIRGNPQPRPRFRPRRPPGPRTRERKVKSKIPGLIISIQKAGHTVTEILDAIDAIYDALPKQYRPKGKPTPQQKLEALYKNWDKIDVNAAIINLIKNQIIDAVVGRIAGGAQDYATSRGITLGRTGLSALGV